MFCSECGFEINDPSIRFCPECGTQVEDMYTAARGVIFTNISLLAARLHTDKTTVTNIISDYIERKCEAGICYRLVDVGDYTYSEAMFPGFRRTASLNQGSALKDYMDILIDVFNTAVEEGEEDWQYLFIIGGIDIIPMPRVKHFVPNGSDRDIDTDILWSYPHRPNALKEIESQEIFAESPMYLVGRLPFAEGATVDDLRNYLSRSLDHNGGVPLTSSYGQCDPNWMTVSGSVVADLHREGYMPDMSRRLPADCWRWGLVLSPNVTAADVDKVINKHASLYYFNLHGSDGYEASGYYGAALGTHNCSLAIEPRHMAACDRPNIAISEACYGGRFIGMDKSHSMMLSSIYNQTLAFVGSSRIAWGAVDECQEQGTGTVNIDYADVLAYQFIGGIMQGATVAEAFFIARSVLLMSCHPGDPYAAASVVEFNLYGDPTTFLDVDRDFDDMNKSLVSPNTKAGCTIEPVKSAGQSSILDMVRSYVDSNINEIHNKINDHLYMHYGIEPRPADDIFRLKYADGSQELVFGYNTPLLDSVQQLIVTSDPDGKVKKVCSSR